MFRKEQKMNKKRLLFAMMFVMIFTFSFVESFAVNDVLQERRTEVKANNIEQERCCKKKKYKKGHLKNPYLPQKGVKVTITPKKKFKYKFGEMYTGEEAIAKIEQLGGEWNEVCRHKYDEMSPNHTLVLMPVKGKVLSGISRELTLFGFEIFDPVSLKYFHKKKLRNLSVDYIRLANMKLEDMMDFKANKNGKKFNGYYALYVPKKIKTFYNIHKLEKGGEAWVKYKIKHPEPKEERQ